MKILLVGGGSLGPVTPLLATAKVLCRLVPSCELRWAGTSQGPERELVEQSNIIFEALPTAKWPRYISLAWLTFFFHAWQARQKARALIEAWKPDAVVAVGGFTAVPVMYAAARRGIPCMTHQLDLEPGLANRLIARVCTSVTTSFSYKSHPFGSRVYDEQIPTPVRFSLTDLPTREPARRFFGLASGKPVVLIFGGGQGAQALNNMTQRTRSRWSEFAQVIHVTGPSREPVLSSAGYVSVVTLDQEGMRQAYAAADLIIARGGMGTLSEAAALAKAAIIVPLPNSHQEVNAQVFAAHEAVTIVRQTLTDFDAAIISRARQLLSSEQERRRLGLKAHAFFSTDDGTAFAKRILQRVR